MKNRPQQVKRSFQKHEGEMCISAVTLGELVFGAEYSQQVERNLTDIEALVARLEVLPLDSKAAYHFGQIRAALFMSQPHFSAAG
ncbi:MAG: type II toxin-antitoxin system VapC family toxin [Desulfobacteraceae bacterium]|nr:type II toxin-antitoxin system VapC family toxin [Desulfobacteraceae bacterium]